MAKPSGQGPLEEAGGEDDHKGRLNLAWVAVDVAPIVVVNPPIHGIPRILKQLPNAAPKRILAEHPPPGAQGVQRKPEPPHILDEESERLMLKMMSDIMAKAVKKRKFILTIFLE